MVEAPRRVEVEETKEKDSFFKDLSKAFLTGAASGVAKGGALALSQELIKVKNDNKVIKPRSTEKNVVKYNIYKSDIANFLSQTVVPPSNKEKPTEKDYTRGYFTRYFVKKSNSV